MKKKSTDNDHDNVKHNIHLEMEKRSRLARTISHNETLEVQQRKRLYEIEVFRRNMLRKHRNETKTMRAKLTRFESRLEQAMLEREFNILPTNQRVNALPSHERRLKNVMSAREITEQLGNARISAGEENPNALVLMRPTSAHAPVSQAPDSIARTASLGVTQLEPSMVVRNLKQRRLERENERKFSKVIEQERLRVKRYIESIKWTDVRAFTDKPSKLLQPIPDRLQKYFVKVNHTDEKMSDWHHERPGRRAQFGEDPRRPKSKRNIKKLKTHHW